MLAAANHFSKSSFCGGSDLEGLSICGSTRPLIFKASCAMFILPRNTAKGVHEEKQVRGSRSRQADLPLVRNGLSPHTVCYLDSEAEVVN